MVDTSTLSIGSEGIHLDFCTISRTSTKYTVIVDNSYWTKGYYILDSNGSLINPTCSLNNNTLTITTSADNIRIFFYLGVNHYDSLTRVTYNLVNDVIQLNYKQLKSSQDIKVYPVGSTDTYTVSTLLDVGFNEIQYSSYDCGFLLVKLLKSDFQFQCTDNLIIGKVNTVKLGTLSDYLPNGDMIGTNTPTIQVLYKDTYIPVQYDSDLNDYVFELDLTSKQTEGKVRFNVIVDTNDVLNSTETSVTLLSQFENIDTLSKLDTLFSNGGIGRLGNDITLTQDLTLANDVLILGNTNIVNMNSHKIIVPNGKTFKSKDTRVINGENTIQQETGSTVELTNCTFDNCTGLGSVIDCQVDTASLEVENDFTTTIKECTFTDNDLCILHGGELTVENCTVNGKIGTPNYPYFVYQTDGNATLLQNTFNLVSDTQISTDIEFNSCIFTCGESAQINGYDHTELQNNNITQFLEIQRNTSTINVTYYYPAIEDYITLQSDNGYCHSVSDTDYVFKTNVNVRRD